MLRSSSLDSLDGLAGDSIKNQLIDDDLSNVSLTESQPDQSDGVLQDYAEDMSLCEINAKIIYRLLVWEREWKQRDDQLIICEVPADNKLEKPTYLKRFSMFASSLLQTSLAKKSPSTCVESLLDQTIRRVLLSGNGQRLMVTSIGSDMLRHYCADDNPDDPSILFDAIVVGTMVLTIAVDDAAHHWKEESFDGKLYPISLESICARFEINYRYAFPKFYLAESPLLNQIVTYLILQLGYHVLINKSLPFHPELALEFFTGLTHIFPINRLNKYQLAPVDVSSFDGLINGSGNDVSGQLNDSCRYTVAQLREQVDKGVDEDTLFLHQYDVSSPGMRLG